MDVRKNFAIIVLLSQAPIHQASPNKLHNIIIGDLHGSLVSLAFFGNGCRGSHIIRSGFFYL